MKALIPSAKVSLDRERNLTFDVNAHIAFQEVIGESLIESMQAIAADMKAAEAEGRSPKMPSFLVVRALLWAGLRSETLDRDGNETDDTLSLHQIGSMLDFGRMMALLTQIGEAFAMSMQGLPEVDRENPPKAPRQNGNRSTGRGSGALHKSNLGSTSAHSSG